ncbi:glycyl-radical enzyme activating protein [Candidatus Bipolaricaulota bacterium]|nr:glycyl-radical enzyme activating protein [Candidatus Bipolaricaulota bacterium]
MSSRCSTGSSCIARRAPQDGGRTGAALPAVGIVFDIKRYTIHDGPGIRTTVFLKGCPLRCLWCHNPEGVDPQPQVSFVAGRCLGCGACVEACPERAISLAPGALPMTDRAKCVACGRCVAACPAGARALVGKGRSVEEVLALVERDRIFYDRSGGGVTFSGGEPLAQPQFLRACLRECRARGIRTAVDTSGFADRALVMEIAALADLLLYDLKDMNPSRHLRTVGVPLEPILANLEALAQAGAPVWVRIPVIPGVNDDAATIQDYLSYLAGLEVRYPVSLLPYHTIGVEKYRRLGIPYRLPETRPPSQQALEGFVRMFERAGFEIDVGR